MRNTVKEKSKEKLMGTIKETIINDAAKKVLDFAEVSIGDSGRYKSFRAKTLRVLNDIVRKLSIEIQNHYDVEYDSNRESVAVISKNTGSGPGEG
jgi:hypothetical protein